MRRITGLAASVALLLCLSSGTLAAAAGGARPAGGGGADVPTVTASFSSPQALVGDVVTISVHIKNPNPGSGYTGVGIPIWINVAALPQSPSAACGTGTVTISGNEASLLGGTIAANSVCTFSFKAKATVAGTLAAFSSTVTSSMGSSIGHIDTFIPVLVAPTISAAYSPSSTTAGGTTSLVLTLTNPAANAVAMTNAGVVATLPSGLSVKSGTGSAGSCGGTLKRTAPTGIKVTGVKIPKSGKCKITVAVTTKNAGSFTTKATVLMDYGSGGGATIAGLTVIAPTAAPASPTAVDSSQPSDSTAPSDSAAPSVSPPASPAATPTAAPTPPSAPASSLPVAPASMGGDSGSLGLIAIGVAIGLLLALAVGAGAWMVMRRKRTTAPAD
jgi:hypothetical protein